MRSGNAVLLWTGRMLYSGLFASYHTPKVPARFIWPSFSNFHFVQTTAANFHFFYIKFSWLGTTTCKDNFFCFIKNTHLFCTTQLSFFLLLILAYWMDKNAHRGTTRVRFDYFTPQIFVEECLKKSVLWCKKSRKRMHIQHSWSPHSLTHHATRSGPLRPNLSNPTMFWRIEFYLFLALEVSLFTFLASIMT